MSGQGARRRHGGRRTGFRALDLPLQEGQKLLRGTGTHQHTSCPASIQDEGRNASDADFLPVVQIAQHTLEGFPALQAGAELGAIQIEVRCQLPQRRLRVIARGPLLQPLE
jgi:hypothetical protein